MICPHCGKDAEKIYPEGRVAMTRQEAEVELGRKLEELDTLDWRGAYGPHIQFGNRTRLEERYDELLDECAVLETALGR